MNWNLNLLEETVEIMRSNGKSPEDVAWVGSADGQYVIDWDGFAKLADRTYYAGYGGQEVAKDLVVVFKDGSYLYRDEYDGGEWWEYAATPIPAENPKTLRRIFAEDCGSPGWKSLKELNDDDECERIRRIYAELDAEEEDF